MGIEERVRELERRIEFRIDADIEDLQQKVGTLEEQVVELTEANRKLVRFIAVNLAARDVVALTVLRMLCDHTGASPAEFQRIVQEFAESTGLELNADERAMFVSVIHTFVRAPSEFPGLAPTPAERSAFLLRGLPSLRPSTDEEPTS